VLECRRQRLEQACDRLLHRVVERERQAVHQPETERRQVQRHREFARGQPRRDGALGLPLAQPALERLVHAPRDRVDARPQVLAQHRLGRGVHLRRGVQHPEFLDVRRVVRQRGAHERAGHVGRRGDFVAASREGVGLVLD